MSKPTARHRRVASGLRLGAGAAAVLTLLSGCSADKVLDAANPVNWYRDLTGASKNDTAPDAANSANLESGSKEPYPDLSSVPNEPSRGLTEEQKKQLAEGLISDRDNARYVDQQVRGGNAGATAPPQARIPEEQLPYAGGPNATPSATPPAPPGPTSPRPPGAPPNPTVSSAAPAAPPPPQQPVAASREAALAPPVQRATPQPQDAAAPPPPPQLPPVPPPAPEAPYPGAPAGHPAPPTAPEQVAGVPAPPTAPVRPEPTPSGPAVAPVPAVSPTASTGPIGKHAKSAQIAEIAFTAGSKALDATAAAALAKVPSLHQQYGGIVRIVAYAPAADSGSDPAGTQLVAYQAALDRATAVKQALVQAGIPAAEIFAEAARVRGTGPAPDRADIYVEY